LARSKGSKSGQSFEEMSWGEEAGGPGSLLVSEVKEMQGLRRNGFSYHDIEVFTNHSASTVYKWTHAIAPEAYFEPGLSLQEKLSRHLGRPITWPPPREGQIAKSSHTIATTTPPATVDPTTETPKFTTHTFEVFEGALYVTRTRLGVVPFNVPSGVLQPAIFNFTATGLPFEVQLLNPYQWSHFGRTSEPPPPFLREYPRDYYYPYTWLSPVVTEITKTLSSNYAGNWKLVFRNAPELDRDNSIKVDATLTTRRPTSH